MTTASETYERGIARALLDEHLGAGATDDAVNAFHWSVIHAMPVAHFERLTRDYIDGWLAAYRWSVNCALPDAVPVTVDAEIAHDVAIRNAERALGRS